MIIIRILNHFPDQVLEKSVFTNFMVREIQAKTILNPVPQPDTWFGLKYNMNLYRGCQHQCIYCDSRSSCYQLGDLADIRVKVNALELLADALPRKRVRGTIGFGSMNDPYMPVEREYRLTRGALKIIARNRFPIHLMTKSDLVLEDLELIKEISRRYAAVTFTITTADDQLASVLEPGAPPPSARFAAMKAISAAGVLTGVTMMPILPFLEDTKENVSEILHRSLESGADYIIPAFGMTLREGSREYFYQKLEVHFPGIKEQYIRTFGSRYQCSSPNWEKLNRLTDKFSSETDIPLRIPIFNPRKRTAPDQQLDLF
jgi:DNA repair photolyase